MKTMKLSPGERRRFWFGHIENWRESGLSRTAYCKNNGINLSQLIYWLRKAEPTAAAQPKQSSFIRVNTTQEDEVRTDAGRSCFRLQLRDSMFLHWQGEANPQYIHQLMKVLSE